MNFKAFFKWALAHRITSLILAGAVIFAAVAYENGGPRQRELATVAFLVLIAVAVWLMERGMGKILSIALAAALVWPTSQQAHEPKTAAVAAGVVVIVVGGVVVVVLVRTCKKLFPKSKATNDPPTLRLAGGDTYGASEMHFGDYCWENDLKAARSVEVLVDGEVGAYGRITQFALRQEKEAITLDEFRAQVAALGLSLDYGTHYAINGRPAQSWEVPLEVTQGEVPHVRLNGAGPSRTIVVERTEDFISWTPLVTNTVPEGVSVRFSDNSDAAAKFYRTRMLL